jgi:signal transduction histidine kinase
MGATPDGSMLWAMHPIAAAGRLVGAAYVQAPEYRLFQGFILMPALLGAGLALAALVVVFTPIGLTFGLLTMRGPVRRLRELVGASTDLAAGNFSRRVQPRGADEVAQLERQFNETAGKLEGAVQAQRDLAARNARLAERGRIARELHESISQELFSLRLTLGGLEMDERDPELTERLGQLGESVSRAIRQMRALMLELRPVDVDQLDLEAGLRELATAYAARLGIAVDADIEPVQLDVDRADALLRIAQEALSNVARHSGASRIELALRRSGDAVNLSVTDDGRGFDPAAPESRLGIGLELMRERAAEIGGRAELRSDPKGGTRLLVTLPGASA